jgi:UPF0176 protein
LVAAEGINLFLAGTEASISTFVETLKSDSRFASIVIKYSKSDAIPFRRLKVKFKKEIITFGHPSLCPEQERAKAISPQQLAQWLTQAHDDQGRELVLLDTRNQHEIKFGTFHNALTLPIQKFTELPQAIQAHRASLQGKAIVSFCTGGIRCEKAALWMQQDGFDHVYQLDGGILNYFEQVGTTGYDGTCFVFDERESLTAELMPTAEPH